LDPLRPSIIRFSIIHSISESIFLQYFVSYNILFFFVNSMYLSTIQIYFAFPPLFLLH